MPLKKKDLTKAAKELEEILKPTDDEGNPEKITDAKIKVMKEKIIEAAGFLTPEDGMSEHLSNVLNELGITVGEETEDVSEEKPEEVTEEETEITWELIDSLNKKELEQFCEDQNLISEADDYEELIDFKKDVATELNIEFPENDEVEEVEEEVEEDIIEEDIIEDDSEEEEVDLVDLVTGTKKLAHLKEIAEVNDEFKKIRKGLKKFKGLEGVKLLKAKMRKMLGVEEEITVSKKDVDKVLKESEEYKEEAEKIIKKSNKTKKVGVIATIVDCISKQPITKENILKILVKTFPDRLEEAMKKTINVQVPNRIKKEKNDSLTKNDKNEWYFTKSTAKAEKTPY